MVLLVTGMVICYAQRGALPFAAPTLIKELQISKTDMGFLLSAFFYLYSFMQMPAGWHCDNSLECDGQVPTGAILMDSELIATALKLINKRNKKVSDEESDYEAPTRAAVWGVRYPGVVGLSSISRR